jgi:hypothetical protein
VTVGPRHWHALAAACCPGRRPGRLAAPARADSDPGRHLRLIRSAGGRRGESRSRTRTVRARAEGSGPASPGPPGSRCQ